MQVRSVEQMGMEHSTGFPEKETAFQSMLKLTDFDMIAASGREKLQKDDSLLEVVGTNCNIYSNPLAFLTD